ncbi:MAG: GNAT family N-acetyltransferase [Pseudomonadales bacterium]
MIEIRPAEPHEMSQLGLLAAYAYAGAFGDGPDNIVATANRPEWTLCAFDHNEMVASFCTIPFTMRAVDRAIPLGGISAVGTNPEYRRQGLLRQLMSQGLEDMYLQGRPVAALWASQAAIYQRYQFSLASVLRTYTIDTVDINFHEDPGITTTLSRVDPADNFQDVKAIYRQFVASRLGYLHRSQPMWQANTFDSSQAPVHLVLARDPAGTALGYMVYTLRSGHSHPARGQVIKVRDLAWLTPGAWRDLWRFVAAHDLVGKVQWENAPRDDPAPEFLVEPRLLQTHDREGYWFRIVDVAGALAGRGYLSEGEISLGIADDSMTPWNNGTWRLRIHGDDAEVEKSQATPDIQLSLKALASLYTGFRSAHELARWGLLEGSPEAVSRADRLFRTPHAPHCPDNF